MNRTQHSSLRLQQAALLVALSFVLLAPASAHAATSTGGDKGVLLSMRSIAGFARPFTNIRALPLHVVTDDRTHYQPADIANSNALVDKAVSSQMTKKEFEMIDALAKSAGLDTKVDWGVPDTPDVPLLSITYRGRTQDISSYGVGEKSLTKKQRAMRAKVAKLIAALDVQSSRSTEVKPSALAVAAVEANDVPKNGQRALTSQLTLAPPVITVQDWPASAPKLSSIGDCRVVTEPAAVVLLSTSADTVRFRSDGKVWEVFARILLPGDPGCS